MSVYTIDKEFEQAIHHVNQMASGGSYVAIFTLRLSPAPELEGYEFSSIAIDPYLESEPWIGPAIERGIKHFVKERADAGRPVGRFRAVLIDILIHHIDSKERAFKEAGFMAMTEAFATHEIIVDK